MLSVIGKDLENMSHTKYIVGGKSQLQDPEAILPIESVSEKDEKVIISSNIEQKPVENLDSENDKISNGNSPNRNFEYPTVTINGEPTQDTKIIHSSDQSSFPRSRLQSISEPDLTQVGLYDNQKDYLLNSGPNGQKEDIRKKIHQKIGK